MTHARRYIDRIAPRFRRCHSRYGMKAQVRSYIDDDGNPRSSLYVSQEYPIMVPGPVQSLEVGEQTVGLPVTDESPVWMKLWNASSFKEAETMGRVLSAVAAVDAAAKWEKEDAKEQNVDEGVYMVARPVRVQGGLEV